MAAKHLVLIGGGHAHMVTLANLRSFTEKGFRVTVIQPSEYHYYSGMGPGMLGMTYSPEDIRFATRKVVERQGGNFVLGRASVIDTANQLVRLEGSGLTVPYDVLSCNAGSYVPADMITAADPDIFTVKPIETLFNARQRIVELCREREIDIGVVGGGPSSVEIAGNIWRLCRKSAVNEPHIRIFAGKRLMTRAPAKIRALARASLARRDIRVIEDNYVQSIEAGRIILQNGDAYPADLTLAAVGVKPSPIFAASGLATGPDGGLRVNRQLQSVSHANIFGGGDCIYFEDEPLDKVGVYAVRQNPVLYHNLMVALTGGDLESFDPGGKYLLIYNLGDGTGIFCKWPIIFGGGLAFRIKDYIDRKFMAKFQAMER
ncbi:MAG: FAD-dependent oxidoreductase [Deltaproteobacteria bacterium]|nr:FAD-dependent oxidoreductase [Deltaproteobacteria bacterium]